MPSGDSPLMPLAGALAGYLFLQIILNIAGNLVVRRSPTRALTALRTTFSSTIVNALYFICAAVLLHVYHVAPNTPPKSNYGLLALAGLPFGLLVWYLSALGRKIGVALFGRSELIAAEDAALHVAASPGSPLDARYVGWGVVNLALLQPLGRELFLRGAFLPAIALGFGFGWAVACTVLLELLLRLNVVWAPQTVLYALLMCGMFYLTGSALTGLVGAAVAGLIHALALVYLAGRRRPDDGVA